MCFVFSYCIMYCSYLPYRFVFAILLLYNSSENIESEQRTLKFEISFLVQGNYVHFECNSHCYVRPPTEYIWQDIHREKYSVLIIPKEGVCVYIWTYDQFMYARRPCIVRWLFMILLLAGWNRAPFNWYKLCSMFWMDIVTYRFCAWILPKSKKNLQQLYVPGLYYKLLVIYHRTRIRK